MYRQFFHLPGSEKERVSMAKTGSNRGSGASGSEQVDPNANPDYKEVFDSGYVPSPMHLYAAHSVYAPNQWPDRPADFERVIKNYYAAAMRVAVDVLRAIASVLNLDSAYFTDKFSHPMALLRGNYYPARPDWAGDKDFGIAAHTDYGCDIACHRWRWRARGAKT
jgi:isopenicillin N synthase-like dioxygenase